MEEYLLPIAVVAPVLCIVAAVGLLCLPKIRSKSKCGNCGYSRDGLPDRSNCPECGRDYGLEVDPSYRRFIATLRHRFGLVLGTLGVGLSGSVACFAMAVSQLGLEGVPLSLVVGLLPILPVFAVGPLTYGRIPRSNAWGLAMTCAVAGTASATIIYGEVRSSSYSFPPLDMTIAGAWGAAISALVFGLLGTLIAARWHYRERHLSRRRRDALPEDTHST